MWVFLLYMSVLVTPPRRPARPRPRRAAAPAPVVSSLLAALIRTPLSCRPADLTLTRAIERVGHARRHRRPPPRAQHRVRSGVGAVGRRVLLAVARRRRGALRRAPRSTHDGVPPCGHAGRSLPSDPSVSSEVRSDNTSGILANTRFQYACTVLLIHRLPPYYG